MTSTLRDAGAATVDRSGLDIVIVAGEASGDLLGAELIRGLQQRYPAARFSGVGGPAMQAAGFDAWYPADALAVMGLAEVVRHLPRLLKLRRDVLVRTLKLRPGVFVGIDAPDFNLGLERKLKQADVATVHYVSPSVWAWRESRAAKIGRSADKVLCLFPMEPAIYARHGVDAQFVGHPLADRFAMEPNQAAAREKFCLALDAPVLAILPGSRLGEISRLGADFIAAARLLRPSIPELVVLAPMANAGCREAFDALLDDADRGCIRVIDGDAHAAMIAADVVLLASGTAALEALLAKRPMVVAYRLSNLTYRIVKLFGLMKVDHYSLPNFLSQSPIVPELMQDDCRPDALAAVLLPALRERRITPDLLAEYQRIHQSLRGDAEHDAAAAVAQLIENQGS
ncbi:MAG: lipid-A-disaccharide synthase [Dokdonella sp.]